LSAEESCSFSYQGFLATDIMTCSLFQFEWSYFW